MNPLPSPRFQAGFTSFLISHFGCTFVPGRISMSMRAAKWIPLAAVLTLLLLGHSFAGNLEYGIGSWEVPPRQPDQMWSQVEYDPKLSDPFFKSNEWSYPWWIIEHRDGHFESIRSEGERPVKKPPRLKHTAECFSTSSGSRHLVEFCEAKFLNVNMIGFLIHHRSPAFDDALRIQIKNGMFACQYWTFPKVLSGQLIWKTKRQMLTLDKKVYRKGDVIKGIIDFECVGEGVTDLKSIEKSDKHPTTIKVYGVFKTILE